MKVLFIGGTGNIGTAVSRLAVERGIDLFLLNRGTRRIGIPGVRTIKADISQEASAAQALARHTWDAVVNWIAFTPADIARDLRLFQNKTRQYIFISSASVYQKPLAHPVVTESTPLANPYWEYARQKIAAEDCLHRACRENGFPGVIVRPSLTYDTVIPLALGSWADYTMIDRMKRGKPVVVHGDGASLWTITHAQDFAKGLVGLLGNDQARGHAFHITSDELLTWDQIWQQTAAAAGVEPRIVHVPTDLIVRVVPDRRGSLLGDKAVSVIFDNSKIKRFVPGYTASIPYREGIRRTVAWFEARKSRMRIVAAHNEMHDRILEAYGRLAARLPAHD